MKFTYIEIPGIKATPGVVPGKEIARLICQTLGGKGPFERGDYGWEWVYRGKSYKALAVLQQYGQGWLIPVNAGFIDRLFKRDGLLLEDLTKAIQKALGTKVTQLQNFETEQEFRASGV